MPLVRAAREASTGLTTTVAGTAATPNAGPNNWSGDFNDWQRLVGGGMWGSSSGPAYNVLGMDLGAILKKFILVIANPSAAKGSGWSNQGTVEWRMTTGWLSETNKYVFDCFVGSGQNFFTMYRAGTGAVGGDQILVNHSSLNDTIPWTFTVEETSAGVFSCAVTDGTTTVNGTFTDTGTSIPTGTRLALTERKQFIIVNDFDMYVDGATPQLAAPTSDITAGWTPSTGSTIYGVIDEATADDGDYAYTNSNATAEVKFEPLDDPAVNTGHIVRYRLSVASGTTCTVSLRQGATLIDSWVHTGPVSLTTFEQTLGGTEADSITDYTDLRLRAVTS